MTYPTELNVHEQAGGECWEWISPGSGDAHQYRLDGGKLHLYRLVGEEWRKVSGPVVPVPEGMRPRDLVRNMIVPKGVTGYSVVMHGPPCWNGWCILGEACDGTHHGDFTGRSWEEVRPDWLPDGERLSVRVYGTD